MSDDPRARLRKVELAQLSSMVFETFVLERGRLNLVVVLTFRGRYRDGSEGNPDARFMEAQVLATLTALDPSAAVLDLSELDYRWGDGLVRPMVALDAFLYEEGQPRFPWFLVLGPGCRPATLTLLDEPPANERPDLATALADAEAAAAAWPR